MTKANRGRLPYFAYSYRFDKINLLKSNHMNLGDHNEGMNQTFFAYFSLMVATHRFLKNMTWQVKKKKTLYNLHIQQVKMWP